MLKGKCQGGRKNKRAAWSGVDDELRIIVEIKSKSPFER